MKVADGHGAAEAEVEAELGASAAPLRSELVYKQIDSGVHFVVARRVSLFCCDRDVLAGEDHHGCCWSLVARGVLVYMRAVVMRTGHIACWTCIYTTGDTGPPSRPTGCCLESMTLECGIKKP